MRFCRPTKPALIVAIAMAAATGVGLKRAAAAPVILQNATSDLEQNNSTLSVATTIDGIVAGTNGWGMQATVPDLAFPNAAVWETASDASGTMWTFTLDQLLDFGGGTDGFTFRKIQLSYTTDDRSTFADGLGTGGDTTASWTALAPSAATATISTATINGDNSISWSDPDDPDTYTVVVNAGLIGVTGFRLDLLTDFGTAGGAPLSRYPKWNLSCNEQRRRSDHLD